MTVLFNIKPESVARSSQVENKESLQIDLEKIAFPSRKILIASDTYPNQVNGVERSLVETQKALAQLGHKVALIRTDPKKSWPLPRRPEIKVAVPMPHKLREMIESFNPDSIHIATEGTIGMQMRVLCRKLNLQFTSSFHTLWPDFAYQHAKIPKKIAWKFLKWFHSAAGRTMTRSESMSQILRGQEFKNVEIWHGGVELDIFYPRGKGAVELLSQKKYPKKQIERPIMMYVGRVSKEKNLEAFLSLDNLTGTKVIVGGDSYKQVLEKKYPDAIFLGPYPADKLPEIYSDADVFVMPSKTDTFGRVMVEALACGVPVAAFPVTGSKDIVNTSSVGALNENLKIAIEEALLNSDLDSCVKRAQDFSHLTVAQQFLKNLIETKT